jgi:hypothetical protein
LAGSWGGQQQTNNFEGRIMNIPAIEPDEIEFSANLTLAYTILASESRNNYVVFVYRLSKVASQLKKLLPILTSNYLRSMTGGQRHRITLRLQDAHKLLAQLSRSPETETLSRFPVLRRMLNGLQKETEELADVLDYPVLADKRRRFPS